MLPLVWPEKRGKVEVTKKEPKSDREWEDIISPAQLGEREGIYGEINEWNDLYG